MSHERYIEGVKVRIAELASEMLAERRGLVEGARLIVRLKDQLDDPSDPRFEIFEVVASEAEDLPVGPERSLWASDALARKDRERAEYEGRVREAVLQACRGIVDVT